MRLGLIIASALLLTTAAAAQQDFDKVEIKVTNVSGNIYMLQGAGGNIGVSVGEDGILLVDDQYAPLAPKIKAALKGISDKPVRFILNTHWHGDHTGGNETFGESAPLIAHKNVRNRLITGGTLSNGRSFPPAKKGALPVITFQDGLVVHLNGEDIRAVHMPHGHTDGDSVIYFTGSNVVHMGDHFFVGFLPFIDVASGGTVHGMIRNVEKVLEEVPDDVKIIPGHGPLSTKKDLRDYLAILKETSAIVQAGIDAGKSLEQLQKENVLAKWGDDERYLRLMYEDLSRARK
jgi:cyclase